MDKANVLRVISSSVSGSLFQQKSKKFNAEMYRLAPSGHTNWRADVTVKQGNVCLAYTLQRMG